MAISGRTRLSITHKKAHKNRGMAKGRRSYWAEKEFGGCELGDMRRTRRLIELAGARANRPSAPLPESLGSASEAKAGYRFYENRRYDLTHQRHAPHGVIPTLSDAVLWIAKLGGYLARSASHTIAQPRPETPDMALTWAAAMERRRATAIEAGNWVIHAGCSPAGRRQAARPALACSHRLTAG